MAQQENDFNALMATASNEAAASVKYVNPETARAAQEAADKAAEAAAQVAAGEQMRVESLAELAARTPELSEKHRARLAEYLQLGDKDLLAVYPHTSLQPGGRVIDVMIIARDEYGVIKRRSDGTQLTMGRAERAAVWVNGPYDPNDPEQNAPAPPHLFTLERGRGRYNLELEAVRRYLSTVSSPPISESRQRASSLSFKAGAAGLALALIDTFATSNYHIEPLRQLSEVLPGWVGAGVAVVGGVTGAILRRKRPREVPIWATARLHAVRDGFKAYNAARQPASGH